MRILAVIPARGGSKGIPRKNIRLLAGKPLIYYSIRTARSCSAITDVAVTTDSAEIGDLAEQYGAEVVFRALELSTDEVTLDPVVCHAAHEMEERTGAAYDVVITLQPTTPLLRHDTLAKGLDYFFSGAWDTVLSAVNKPRLFWEKRGDAIVPLYTERRNRQNLRPQYLETGAFLITGRAFVTADSRIGRRVSVFETDEDESVELRTPNDWLLAEHRLGRKRIVFRADGYRKLGMGHIYNCLTMAYSLMMEHDVLLVLHERSVEGLKKVQESFLPYIVIHDDAEIDRVIANYQPDIWVNDCLNTDEAYILHLKEKVPRVITVEDLGTGSEVADAAINALYIEEGRAAHVYSGYEYVCLREEFLIEEPRAFSEEVRSVIIMFGGTDPANLNQKIYRSLLKYAPRHPAIRFSFITGVGYDCASHGVVTREDCNIFVHPNVPRVSKYMKEADLAITSQGRAIFELAAMGVPAIVLSQNRREQTHRFAQMANGFINLGMGEEVEQAMIENTLDWLIHTPSVRRNMHELLLQYPLREGVTRVRDIILGRGGHSCGV
mgnify:FL=1